MFVCVCVPAVCAAEGRHTLHSRGCSTLSAWVSPSLKRFMGQSLQPCPIPRDWHKPMTAPSSLFSFVYLKQMHTHCNLQLISHQLGPGWMRAELVLICWLTDSVHELLGLKANERSRDSTFLEKERADHPHGFVNLLVSPLCAFSTCEYLVSYALFWSCAFWDFWPTIFCWTIGHLFVFVVFFFKWITLKSMTQTQRHRGTGTLQKPVCDITEAIPIFIQWQLIRIHKVDRDYDTE